MPAPTPKKAASMKFEGAMEKLERLVEEMERAELPLEDLLKRYEEGMELVKFCAEALSQAEQKVEILSRASQGLSAQISGSQPFEPQEDTDENEDVSLF